MGAAAIAQVCEAVQQDVSDRALIQLRRRRGQLNQLIAEYEFRHAEESPRPEEDNPQNDVPGATIEEARSAAIVLLPALPQAMGFRICDRTDRQVDIYVPPDWNTPCG